MIPWTVIGVIAAFLTMFGFVPQIVKMYRTKLVHDVTAPSPYQFAAGLALWAVYGYAIGDLVIIGANLVSFITLMIALLLYYHYKALNRTSS